MDDSTILNSPTLCIKSYADSFGTGTECELIAILFLIIDLWVILEYLSEKCKLG